MHCSEVAFHFFIPALPLCDLLLPKKINYRTREEVESYGSGILCVCIVALGITMGVYRQKWIPWIAKISPTSLRTATIVGVSVLGGVVGLMGLCSGGYCVVSSFIP